MFTRVIIFCANGAGSITCVSLRSFIAASAPLAKAETTIAMRLGCLHCACIGNQPIIHTLRHANSHLFSQTCKIWELTPIFYMFVRGHFPYVY